MVLCVHLTVILRVCGACAGGMQEAVLVSFCSSSCASLVCGARPFTILNQPEHQAARERLHSDLMPLTNIVAL